MIPAEDSKSVRQPLAANVMTQLLRLQAIVTSRCGPRRAGRRRGESLPRQPTRRLPRAKPSAPSPVSTSNMLAGSGTTEGVAVNVMGNSW
jgi:hypothetical protein